MADDRKARAELEKLATDFTEGFNHDDIDEVMSYFADDAFYDEFNAVVHTGKDAIREGFIPQFRGDFGKMRFHTEDMFVDVDTGKALIRWLLTFEKDDRAAGWRGLDILHFKDGKLVEKHTYAKAKTPVVEKAQESENVRRAIAGD